MDYKMEKPQEIVKELVMNDNTNEEFTKDSVVDDCSASGSIEEGSLVSSIHGFDEFKEICENGGISNPKLVKFLWKSGKVPERVLGSRQSSTVSMEDFVISKIISATSTVPPDEMRKLLKTTNYSKREIIDFYTRTDIHDKDDDGLIDFEEFQQLCAGVDLKQKKLVEMLWTFFDHDRSGSITRFEMVQGIAPITRGKLEDLARMFFRFYDAEKDGLLDADEMILGYSVLMAQRNMVQVNDHHNLNGSLLQRGFRQKLTFNETSDERLETVAELPIATQKNIAAWVEEQKQKYGKLDEESFVKAVVANDLERTRLRGGGDANASRWRDGCLFIHIMLFTIGGIFALFAVAAMSDRFMARMDIDESQIGLLNTAYFFAAIVGPFVGGMIMDNFAGPGVVAVGANFVVAIGALIQWMADKPELYNLLLFGRFLIGFGLETTFIAWDECNRKAFPSVIGLVMGISTAVMMVTTFASFQVIPAVANSKSDYSDGTDFSLFFCFLLSLLSLYATVVVAAMFYFEDRAKQANSIGDSDQAVLIRTFGALAKAATPGLPSGFAKFKFPVSFFLFVVGVKSVCFYFNTFSLYAVGIYTDKFGMSGSQASLATGLAPLLAIPFAIGVGGATDKIGSRPRLLTGFTLSGVVGLALLRWTDSEISVWIATVLFSGMVSCIGLSLSMLPLIAGPARTGLGFGIYSILGNGLDAVNAYICGSLAALGENGQDYLLLYSMGFVLFGMFCWITVYFLEREMSFVERPTDQIVETKLETLQAASVCGHFSAVGNNPDSMDTTKEESPEELFEEHPEQYPEQYPEETEGSAVEEC